MQQFPPKMNGNLTDDEYRLCVRVALLYYENNLTQNEIGEMLGYSRVKINRVLRQARDAGIVEICIHTPETDYYLLEDQLVMKYGLRDACIVQDADEGQELYLTLARGAIGWLGSRLEPGMRIGLGLGRTISHLPQVFQLERQVNCTFTEVVGAASDFSGGITSYNVISKLAELAGGNAEMFYAPMFVSNPALKQVLYAEPSVTTALQRARQCDIVLQSVGPVDKTALLYIHGHLSEQELETLRENGAVGDALGHYFNIHGELVSYRMDDCLIGLDLKDLCKINWSVLIAGGMEKIRPIIGGLRGKYFNVLVTDRKTAIELLKEENIHAE
ncbi:MAG: hypothetical protein CVU39_08055 [Chloroflexi bacterium HGW-Chloroflexi-10]|nr:MAG: hypothetical protein CVU39_08055 [Chloroflexi bacterium HGW-Chloroflexi-10]